MQTPTSAWLWGPSPTCTCPCPPHWQVTWHGMGDLTTLSQRALHRGWLMILWLTCGACLTMLTRWCPFWRKVHALQPSTSGIGASWKSVTTCSLLVSATPSNHSTYSGLTCQGGKSFSPMCTWTWPGCMIHCHCMMLSTLRCIMPTPWNRAGAQLRVNRTTPSCASSGNMMVWPCFVTCW